jgi:hypothetical protein
MTREDAQDKFDVIENGDRIHVTSAANEWVDARFFLEDEGILYFFDSLGRGVILSTPYIVTQLPEEDEQDTDTVTS